MTGAHRSVSQPTHYRPCPNDIDSDTEPYNFKGLQKVSSRQGLSLWGYQYLLPWHLKTVDAPCLALTRCRLVGRLSFSVRSSAVRVRPAVSGRTKGCLPGRSGAPFRVLYGYKTVRHTTRLLRINVPKLRESRFRRRANRPRKGSSSSASLPSGVLRVCISENHSPGVNGRDGRRGGAGAAPSPSSRARFKKCHILVSRDDVLPHLMVKLVVVGSLLAAGLQARPK